MSYGSLIFNVARAAGFPVALSRLMVAQARHETADFTSNVFRTCNNAFGYKAVGSAPKCTGSPEGDFYKQYSSVQDSAAEVVGWIKRRQQEGRFPSDLGAVNTPQIYARLLKQSGYYGAPESQYAARLAHYYGQPLPSAEKSGSPALFVMAVLVAWGLWKTR